MDLIYRHLFTSMWITWALYWWIASHHAKAVERRESMGSRLLHIVPLLLAVWLLWADRIPVTFLNTRVIPWSPSIFWATALVTAAGLLFAVWARVRIAGNWSGTVTLKQSHELITTGPYAMVRHPIYTGLLAAVAGSALVRGEWRGVLAFVIAYAALWRKLRLEERWMRERFGQQYAEYSRRVPALVPRLKPDCEPRRAP
jgi:protein-S-isoprenylcysteine O-methyltransferase Ste14